MLGGRLRIDGSGVVLTRDESPADPAIPGVDSRRGTLDANWQSTFITPVGIRFDPFVDVRGDLYSLAELPAPFARNATIARGLPTAGVDVSWPFVKRDGSLTFVLEPLAQIALSPVLKQDPRIPIEDSVDFEFDETNLFQFNKSPGFDLIDSGQRFNVGGRATVVSDDGYYASALIGRSFRAEPDPNLPARAGLSGTSSDWIMAASASPLNGVNFFTRWRLDSRTFGVNFAETGVDLDDLALRRPDPLHPGSAGRHRPAGEGRRLPRRVFHPQELGRLGLRRERVSGVWRQSDFGIVYRDECIRVEILYNRNNTNNGVLGPSQGIGFRLSLATFGNSVYARSEAETQPVPQ